MPLFVDDFGDLMNLHVFAEFYLKAMPIIDLLF